ncbi:unnamed protein product, partial [Symbiodinium pilosum]
MDSGAGVDAVSPFNPGQLYKGLPSVTIDIDGEPIVVKIDSVYGPQPTKVGGVTPGPNDYFQLPMNANEHAPNGLHKKWCDFTITEQKMAVYQVARMNKMRQEHADAWMDRVADYVRLQTLQKETDALPPSQ